MDSITQAALGAAIGEAALGKKIGNKGAALGAIIATIPDLDVILYLFYDKLEMLSIHRGFSHSILFSFLASIFIAYILRKTKWTKGIPYKKLLFFSFLALFTHIVLDAFTAYGTQLLLPFSDQRIGLDSINVIDPLYTLPLIIGLILSLLIYRNKPERPIYNRFGLIASSAYLLFALAHKQQINTIFAEEFSKKKIEYQSLLTMPIGSANLAWYGVAKTQDSLYLQKYSTFDGMVSPLESFPINDSYLDEIDPVIADKMKWFAKGFYTVEKIEDRIRIYNLQVDMRGTTNVGGKKAPTLGYFVMTQNRDGSFNFSSGSHEAKN